MLAIEPGDSRSNKAGEQMTRDIRCSTTELHGPIPVAGFEPATSRVSSEVTLVFTTGRNTVPQPVAMDGRHACLPIDSL